MYYKSDENNPVSFETKSVAVEVANDIITDMAAHEQENFADVIKGATTEIEDNRIHTTSLILTESKDVFTVELKLRRFYSPGAPWFEAHLSSSAFKF